MKTETNKKPLLIVRYYSIYLTGVVVREPSLRKRKPNLYSSFQVHDSSAAASAQKTVDVEAKNDIPEQKNTSEKSSTGKVL